MSVVREVEAVETSGLAFGALARKYGIKSADTVQTWVRNYGNGSRGKVIRMEKPEAIEQSKKLKERVRVRVPTAGSLPVELALERAYTHIACERESRMCPPLKKAAGSPGTKVSQRRASRGWCR